MPTKDDLIASVTSRGVPLKWAMVAVDAIQTDHGGVHGWIPGPDTKDAAAHRNGKMLALHKCGLAVSALAERFELTERRVRQIIKMQSALD